MAEKMISFSRKATASIYASLKKIENGTFDEKTLKSLLIDIREFSRFAHKDKEIALKTLEHKNQIELLMDLCDSIAHPTRDFPKSPMIKAIEKGVKNTTKSVAENGFDLSLVPAYSVFSAEGALSALPVLANTYLNIVIPRRKNSKENEASLESFVRFQSDLALCLMSALQDITFYLEGGDFIGRTYLASYNEKYSLYCLLSLKSKINGRSPENEIQISFPLFISSSVDRDKIVCQYSGEATILTGFSESFRFPVYETYRDSSSTLRVRLLCT